MMEAGVMSRLNVSIEQHLKDERIAYADLTLLNIQMEALVDRFQREWLALDSRRQKLVNDLKYHSRFIREHRLLLERTLFPPELKMWLEASMPETAELAPVLDNGSSEQYEPYSDTSCSTVPVTGGQARMLFEDAVSRQIVCWQEGECTTYREREAPSRLVRVAPQPELLLRRCFLPYRKNNLLSTTAATATQGGTWCRRGVGGDVVVMRSPEPAVGRVLVSLHMVHRGDLIMVETPFFTSLLGSVNANEESFLPPVIRDAMALVEQQTAVFATQGWDTRLLRPFYNWLSEMVFGEERTGFAQRWDELGCPVEDVDPPLLSKLSDLAHFLWMSLPSSLSSEIGSEERVLLFFVSLMTNAISYGDAVSETEDFPLGFLEKGVAVFGGLSLIEHSCCPNAVMVFRQGCTADSVLSAELRATRLIGIGERITIAYVPVYLAREERQRRLRTKFFFTCACEHCTLGADTTRLIFTSEGSHEEEKVMLICPRGGGSVWSQLVLCRSAHRLEETGKRYRYDDTCVLDALRDEMAFRQEMNAIDFTCSDSPSTIVMTEVKWLTSVLTLGSGTLVSPFHHLFLLRVLQVVGFVRSSLPKIEVETTQVVLSFLRELLFRLTGVIFVLPEWFIPELFCGEAQGSKMGDDDLRGRLLDNMNKEEDTRRKSWQRSISVQPFFEAHGTLIVSICECYAALHETIGGDNKGTVNAWTACVLLLRHGLCQHASERCLRAQVRALQCHGRCSPSLPQWQGKEEEETMPGV